MQKQKGFCVRSPLWFSLFLGWFLFLFFVSVVASHNIPLDSKLNAGENTNWVSSNGNFALGFFKRSDLTNQYSVGIRFSSNSIPLSEQTVVWVAGGEVGVGCDSFLHLTLAGLALFDSLKGVNVWTSNTSRYSVASASLLDNGNLVLLDKGENVLWESFHTPSDTLLPGQNLSISQFLRPPSRNSVSSYYSLAMDNSGQMKLNWESSVTYWKSGTPSPLISGVIFTEAGALQLVDQKLKPVWSRFGEDHNDSSVGFRFLRLDIDGNLRMYSWISASNSWRSVWQAVDNQCNVFATCGLFGVCAFTPGGTTSCKCPSGSSSSGSNSKCLPLNSEECFSRFSMVALKHTFLYGVYPPNDTVTQTSFEQCKTLCLQNPLCTSVTIGNDGTGQCRMKQTRFISGYESPSLASISYVKVCLDPVAALPRSFAASPPSSPPHPFLRLAHGICIPCLVGAASGTLVGFIVIQIGIGFWFFKRRKAVQKRGTLSHMDLSSSSRGLISLSYSEITDLTGNFKEQLGPKVFKGMLPNNQLVAIKDLKDVIKGASIEEKNFKCAVSVIGCMHHKNLLKLEGYCCESDQRFLVYQYAKNGSVAKWIEDAKLGRRLTWRKRQEICVGVARAMSYLHMGCKEFVSHGNLKWQNVVLDEELEPKVTEFGLGRVARGECHGFGAAEHDVSRYGEMVVRVVSGHHGNGDVCRWAYEEWLEGRAARVADARIEGGVNAEELERTLRIAFWCFQVDERLRPTMGEVVKVLEGTLTVDPPPSPFTCRRPPSERLSDSDSEPNI